MIRIHIHSPRLAPIDEINDRCPWRKWRASQSGFTDLLPIITTSACDITSFRSSLRRDPMGEITSSIYWRFEPARRLSETSCSQICTWYPSPTKRRSSHAIGIDLMAARNHLVHACLNDGSLALLKHFHFFAVHTDTRDMMPHRSKARCSYSPHVTQATNTDRTGQASYLHFHFTYEI